MEPDVFAPRQGLWLGEKEEKGRNTLLSFLAVGGGILALVLSFLFGANHGSAPIGELQGKNVSLVSQVTALQHEVALLRQQWGHCTSDTADFTTIKRLMAQGHFNSAAQVTNLDLSNPHARPCDSLALSQLWYSASVDGLTSAPPTGPADATSILSWESINARATALGLPPEARLSPLTIIATAYNVHNWALCRYVFTQAWGNVIGPADRLEVVTYYSATRNEGRELATNFTGVQRRTGLHLLATAAAIGTYLDRSEAGADLTRLVGPRWARTLRPDTNDPVLHSLRLGH